MFHECLEKNEHFLLLFTHINQIIVLIFYTPDSFFSSVSSKTSGKFILKYFTMVKCSASSVILCVMYFKDVLLGAYKFIIEISFL